MLFSYSIIGPYNESGVTLRHECGTIFHTTPYAFLNGWACPQCTSIAPENLFYKMMRSVSNEEYTLQTEYSSLKNDIILRHKTCGKILETTPYNFIYGGVRCMCRTTISEKNLKKRCQDAGFILLEGESLSGPAIVKCKNCKTIREVDVLKHFLNHPYCRDCEPERFRSVESGDDRRKRFEQKMADLVGVEYDILTPYEAAKKKIELRHNRCGQTFSVRPDAFLHGSRCPHCRYKRIAETRRMNKFKNEQR